MQKLLLILLTIIVIASAAWPQDAAAPAWQETARRVHGKFSGRAGTFAHFGDSITVTLAFWAPLKGERKNATPEFEKAFRQVDAHLQPECWRDWKGPEFGNEGGQTVRWAQAHIGDWLKKLNPEVALIMFGSNDLHMMEAEEYRAKLRGLVERCLDNGTVVILSTPPPQHGQEKKGEEFAKAARAIAIELKVPLSDCHAEILKRRPHDWNGALDKFKDYEDYEVPTLISRDGVHPSFPKPYQNDYSEDALSKSGYTLRSYLTLLKYSEVIKAIGK